MPTSVENFPLHQSVKTTAEIPFNSSKSVISLVYLHNEAVFAQISVVLVVLDGQVLHVGWVLESPCSNSQSQVKLLRIRSCDASSPVQGTRAGCLRLSSVKRWQRVWTGHASCWNGKQRGERPNTRLPLELSSLWESTGWLCGEASAPFSPVKLLSGWYVRGGELAFVFHETSPKNQGDRIIFLEVTM